MNYKISEQRLDDLIKNQLDIIFEPETIHSTNPYEYDEDTGEEYEDPNRIEFYYNDYGDEDTVFYWYDKDYWGQDSESYHGYKSKSPLLQIEEPFLTNLNSLFGNNWHKPFKVWFKENFDVPVKTTMDEIYNRRK